MPQDHQKYLEFIIWEQLMSVHNFNVNTSDSFFPQFFILSEWHCLPKCDSKLNKYALKIMHISKENKILTFDLFIWLAVLCAGLKVGKNPI